jgi:hypothetical protein
VASHEDAVVKGYGEGQGEDRIYSSREPRDAGMGPFAQLALAFEQAPAVAEKRIPGASPIPVGIGNGRSQPRGAPAYCRRGALPRPRQPGRTRLPSNRETTPAGQPSYLKESDTRAR